MLIACLTATDVVGKKNPRRPSSSRSSAAFVPKRKTKPTYMDWDDTTDESSEDDYFPQEKYRSSRSSHATDEFDEDDYFNQQGPAPPKKKAHSMEETSARSEGTFSGAGKGALYDAYNQLHTLAQVCISFVNTCIFEFVDTCH